MGCDTVWWVMWGCGYPATSPYCVTSQQTVTCTSQHPQFMPYTNCLHDKTSLEEIKFDLSSMSSRSHMNENQIPPISFDVDTRQLPNFIENGSVVSGIDNAS